MQDCEQLPWLISEEVGTPVTWEVPGGGAGTEDVPEVVSGLGVGLDIRGDVLTGVEEPAALNVGSVALVVGTVPVVVPGEAVDGPCEVLAPVPAVLDVAVWMVWFGRLEVEQGTGLQHRALIW